MFTGDSEYSGKSTKADYNNLPEGPQYKRAPRMSEQPDMKSSGIGFGNDSGGKVSALLEKP